MGKIECPYCYEDLSGKPLNKREDHIFECNRFSQSTFNSSQFPSNETICLKSDSNKNNKINTKPDKHKQKIPAQNKKRPVLSTRKKRLPVINVSSDEENEKDYLSGARQDVPESTEEEQLRVAIAISKSEAANRQALELNIQENIEKAKEAAKGRDDHDTFSQYDATVYDESFIHPSLKPNNRLFDSNYRNNLLTSSQCDTSLILSEDKNSSQNTSASQDDSIVIPVKNKSLSNSSEVQIEAESFIIPTKLKSADKSKIEDEDPVIRNFEANAPDLNKNSRSLADWSHGPSKRPRLDLTMADISLESSDVEMESNTFEEETQNEPHIIFDIRTIQSTLEYFKKDADKNGDLEKKSKEGHVVKFHKFWLNVRCPV